MPIVCLANRMCVIVDTVFFLISRPIFPILLFSLVDVQIRQWRKNRAPSNCSGFVAYREHLCCYGVDVNRNYDFEFNQLNSRFNNPCSDEFQGPFPFSEPESRLLRNYLLALNIPINFFFFLSYFFVYI